MLFYAYAHSMLFWYTFISYTFILISILFYFTFNAVIILFSLSTSRSLAIEWNRAPLSPLFFSSSHTISLLFFMAKLKIYLLSPFYLSFCSQSISIKLSFHSLPQNFSQQSHEIVPLFKVLQPFIHLLFVVCSATFDTVQWSRKNSFLDFTIFFFPQCPLTSVAALLPPPPPPVSFTNYPSSWLPHFYLRAQPLVIFCSFLFTV